MLSTLVSAATWAVETHSLQDIGYKHIITELETLLNFM